MGGWTWVHSTGNIPCGAIEVGVDKDGGKIFVGRATHCGDVLPAKIIPNHNVAYVAYDGREHAKHEYEVLCRGTCSVTWKESCMGKVPPGTIAVGRTSDNEALYIGRVFHDGTLTPGKIHPSHKVCYIPYDGRELNFDRYEALVLQ